MQRTPQTASRSWMATLFALSALVSPLLLTSGLFVITFSRNERLSELLIMLSPLPLVPVCSIWLRRTTGPLKSGNITGPRFASLSSLLLATLTTLVVVMEFDTRNYIVGVCVLIAMAATGLWFATFGRKVTLHEDGLNWIRTLSLTMGGSWFVIMSATLFNFLLPGFIIQFTQLIVTFLFVWGLSQILLAFVMIQKLLRPEHVSDHYHSLSENPH